MTDAEFRSEFIVQIPLAKTMIFVYPVSVKALHRGTIILESMHFLLLSNIRYRYMMQNGAQMKSCYCWKVPKCMDLALGRT